MSDINIKQQVTELSKSLRLPTIRNQYDTIINQAVEQDTAYDKFLLDVLGREAENRMNERIKSRIRSAGFSQKKYIEDLAREDLPQDGRKHLPGLISLDFIKNRRNVILSGNPGTGKTHIAVGLGIKACMAGYKVFFVTVSRLITQLKESRSERTLRVMENRFEKYDLVICDEFGYITYDKEGAELLFTHLSLRTGKKATIITTNLSFERWTELFGDPVLTAALVDRLTHRAILVNMNGSSYRVKETRNLAALKNEN